MYKEKNQVYFLIRLVYTLHKVQVNTVRAFKTINKDSSSNWCGHRWIVFDLTRADIWFYRALELYISFAIYAPHRTVGAMKSLIFFAGFLAIAAASPTTTQAKVVCYYDSKSYVRECKYIFLFFSCASFSCFIEILTTYNLIYIFVSTNYTRYFSWNSAWKH